MCAACDSFFEVPAALLAEVWLAKSHFLSCGWSDGRRSGYSGGLALCEWMVVFHWTVLKINCRNGGLRILEREIVFAGRVFTDFFCKRFEQTLAGDPACEFFVGSG